MEKESPLDSLKFIGIVNDANFIQPEDDETDMIEENDIKALYYTLFQ